MVTTYAYDALNRLTQKAYNDGTPAVSYSYDASGVANGKGHLTQVANANSVTNYMGFDGLERVDMTPVLVRSGILNRTKKEEFGASPCSSAPNCIAL